MSARPSPDLSPTPRSPLWVGLQPDAAEPPVGQASARSLGAPCGSGFSPTPRSPLWVGLQPDAFRMHGTVGLKADPQKRTKLWVGLQPDAFRDMQSNLSA